MTTGDEMNVDCNPLNGKIFYNFKEDKSCIEN